VCGRMFSGDGNNIEGSEGRMSHPYYTVSSMPAPQAFPFFPFPGSIVFFLQPFRGRVAEANTLEPWR